MTADRIVPVVAPGTNWPVWGYAEAVGELQKAVTSGPRHAWILTGPDASGALAAAQTLAKALCCPVRAADQAYPCNACAVCRRIDRGVFPDVVEFSLQRQIERDGDKSRNLTLNVATVREVTSSLSFRPTEANWKIAIVRDAETMQETSQEAFLKTLEEPPAYAVILLLASDLEPLLPTIQSRCSILRFGLVPEGTIADALVAAGTSSGQAIEISRTADGDPGWAFAAVNDRTILEDRLLELSEARALVAASPYDQLVGCFRMADEFARDRDGTIRRLLVIQRVWRDAMTEALLGTPGEIDGARAAAALRSVRAVDCCIGNLEANVRPRLALEAMVAEWQGSLGSLSGNISQ